MLRHLSGKKGVYIWLIGGLIVVELLILACKSNPEWVEYYYSRTLYPVIYYISIILFSWVPFGVGDIFYALADGVLIYLFYQIFQKTWKKKYPAITLPILQRITAILLRHSVFYIKWGLRWCRIPLQKQLGLDRVVLNTKDHLGVLDKYSAITNALRENIDPEVLSKNGVGRDLQ